MAQRDRTLVILPNLNPLYLLSSPPRDEFSERAEGADCLESSQYFVTGFSYARTYFFCQIRIYLYHPCIRTNNGGPSRKALQQAINAQLHQRSINGSFQFEIESL